MVPIPAVGDAMNGSSVAGPGQFRRAALDSVFLACVVALSLVLYVRRLGFYSDDWSWLAVCSMSTDQSLVGILRSLYAFDIFWARPVQVLHIGGLYSLFGLDPLGYHLVNAALQVSTVILFSAALRELGLPRTLTLAVPVVYALLPHYSTDRFWFLASIANLSMALYFLSLYANLRALRTRSVGAWGWTLLGVGCLLASTLAYEAPLPLFILNPALVWYRARRLSRSAADRRAMGARVAMLDGSTTLALLLVIAFKVLVTTRLGDPIGLVEQAILVASIAKQAVVMNFGEEGLGLAPTVWSILRNHPDGPILALAGAAGLGVFGYLLRSTDPSTPASLDRRSMVGLIAAGLVVFGLAYTIFVPNAAITFVANGLGNRIVIAAAAGVALVMVGALGWASTLLAPEQLRRCLFCGLVALLCASGFLIDNTLAKFWIAAYDQQQAILADILEHDPDLRGGKTLFLDGACPYVGPAPVFAYGWDLTGALQLAYRDDTLRADIVTPLLKIGEAGLSTVHDREYLYPYGKLFVYHAGLHLTHQLIDTQAARAYFETVSPDLGSSCPGYIFTFAP
jgi:hypothetical protein